VWSVSDVSRSELESCCISSLSLCVCCIDRRKQLQLYTICFGIDSYN